MYDHLTWALGDFHSPGRRFPVRLLRYWFGRSILQQQYLRLKRPLSVLEVGIGGGQMRSFVGPSAMVDRWDGLDVKADEKTRSMYSDYIEADIEQPLVLPRRYDAVVLLHVLEHLYDPEDAMTRLLSCLVDGGALIGGSPTMPSVLAAMHEPWLRWMHGNLKVTEHRHLSVITPRRIRRFAQQHDLAVDLLAGTFFCRWTGLIFEDFEWWARANLAWGAVFPSLGGELYFSISKQNSGNSSRP